MTKEEQMEMMWEEHENAHRLYEDYYRKAYRGMSIPEDILHEIEENRRGQ